MFVLLLLLLLLRQDVFPELCDLAASIFEKPFRTNESHKGPIDQ
jgi:hypothetical protein